jgi:hypothetical protein
VIELKEIPRSLTGVYGLITGRILPSGLEMVKRDAVNSQKYVPHLLRRGETCKSSRVRCERFAPAVQSVGAWCYDLRFPRCVVAMIGS